MRSDQDPAVTYEGDNNVLPQQTSNWLLRQWCSKHEDNGEVASPLGTCQYINDGQQHLKLKFKGRNINDVCNIQCKSLFKTIFLALN